MTTPNISGVLVPFLGVDGLSSSSSPSSSSLSFSLEVEDGVKWEIHANRSG